MKYCLLLIKNYNEARTVSQFYAASRLSSNFSQENLYKYKWNSFHRSSSREETFTSMYLLCSSYKLLKIVRKLLVLPVARKPLDFYLPHYIVLKRNKKLKKICVVYHIPSNKEVNL